MRPAASGHHSGSHPVPPDRRDLRPFRPLVSLSPDLQLLVPARAENVAVIRHAFGGLADALALPDQVAADIKLAVTEACTNVVVHAYDGSEGPLEVDASILDEQLTIIVRDHGAGIHPRPDSPGLGLGLPLIATLAQSLELEGGSEDAPTEVRMTFELADPPA